MIEKYEVRNFNWTLPQIRKIEVDSELSDYVWIQGIRVPKRGLFEQYHSTWEAAHAALVEDRERLVGLARHNLRIAERNLEAIKAMVNINKK